MDNLSNGMNICRDSERKQNQKDMFQFSLKPVEECALPGEKVKNLGWFYLTDSWYSINLGEIHLFESSAEWRQKYPGNPQLDYYYIRWLEDFFDILPEVSLSIPQDLYELISNEEKRAATEKQLIDKYESENGGIPEEIYLPAIKFVQHGVLDTGFLRFRSLCRFCRIDDEMVIHYDFRAWNEEDVPVWSAGTGQYKMDYRQFLEEIEMMLHHFFDAMAQQIENAVEIARKNPDKYAISGNKPASTPDEILTRLQQEQKDREEYFYQILDSVKKEGAFLAINWNGVRKALQQADVF